MHPAWRSSLPLGLLLAVATPLGAQVQPASPDEPVGTISLSIEDATAIARARSYRLQRARRNDEVAGLRLATARARTGPQLDLSLNASQSASHDYFRGELLPSDSTDSFFLASVQATASMELDIAGAQRRRVRQARLSRKITGLQRDQTDIDVTAEVRSLYVEALRAQEQVTAEEEVVTRIDSLIVRIGTGKADLRAYLQTERANAMQLLESRRTSADIVQSGLKQALRLPPETKIILTSKLGPPQAIPPMREILDRAYEHRIDLKQSELRLAQEQLFAKQITDHRKPRLFVSAFAAQSIHGDTPFPATDRSRNVSAIVNLNIPLLQYDGGALANDRLTAQIHVEQAKADIEEQRENIETEIRRVLIELTRAQERLRTLPDINQAQAALGRAEAELLAASPDAAPALLAQVTNGRANWRSAVAASTDALSDYHLALYRLQKNMGDERVAHREAPPAP